MRLVLIFAALVGGGYWLSAWSKRLGPARTAQALRWVTVAVGVVVLLLLALRGGATLLLPLLLLLIPLLMRWRALWQPLPNASSGSNSSSAAGDSRSEVVTRFLRMSLEHASGAMQGTVLEGRFAGRELSGLNLEELLALWRDCQVDPRSVAVLETYLDRVRGDDWRETLNHEHEQKSGPKRTAMDRQEAYEILGLKTEASLEEIKAAHRRLMQRIHPDRGGSAYLAARINQARDLLLGK